MISGLLNLIGRLSLIRTVPMALDPLVLTRPTTPTVLMTYRALFMPIPRFILTNVPVLGSGAWQKALITGECMTRLSTLVVVGVLTEGMAVGVVVPDRVGRRTTGVVQVRRTIGKSVVGVVWSTCIDLLFLETLSLETFDLLISLTSPPTP